MKNTSKNGLFQVIEHRKDDDSYFYSNTSYSWYVVSVETGDELMSFYGSDDANSSGRTVSGVSNVYFHDTENILIVEHEETRTEQIELPLKLWLTDNDTILNMEYASGKIEQRERAEAIAISKYGQPFSIKPLKNSAKNKK